MVQCCIRGCSSNSRKNEDGLSFFKFPKNETLQKIWTESIGTENIKPVKLIRVCSKHFEESCINRTLDVVRLKDNVVPTLFPFTSTLVRPTMAFSMHVDNTENVTDAVLQSNTAKYDHLVFNAELTPVKPVTPQGSYSVNESSSEFPSSSVTPELVFSKPDETDINPMAATVELTGDDTFRARTPISMQADNNENSTATVLEIVPMDVDDTGTGSELLQSTTMLVNLASNTRKSLKRHEVSRKEKRLSRIVQLQRKKIKALNQKCLRLKHKVRTFQEIINELREKKIILNEGAILLEECAGSPEFLSRQIAKIRDDSCPRKYGEDLRKFALTLNFLSPKAYKFIRATYRNCLPHPRTLSKWYQRVDAEPGFTAEAFKTLKMKAQTSKTQICCTLIIDEMSIRKGLYWDTSSKKYYGRVNTGINEESDSTEEASECFVMLLTAINDTWKLPVGYFFINSLNGEQKAHLVQICVQMVEETGIKVVALTCDGPAANFSMFQELGCDLNKNQDTTEFSVCSQNIVAFIDPCHAIKLIRNAFGDLGIIIDGEGNQIDFKFIKYLHQKQELEHLHLATKLKKAHVEYHSQKMKVRLATQLFSNSVADALELCEHKFKMPEFKRCGPTAKFIRLLNDLFDCLNSRSLRPPGYKKAIFCKNYGDILKFFDDCRLYITQLKLQTGQLITSSRRKTGFVGMLVNMSSALKLYQRLVVDNHYLGYLPLYKVSQDHLELFFSAILSRGGYNNNPNAVQFKAAYKKLLIRAEIRDHGIGNCIPLEQISILNCPSTNDPVNNINMLTDRKILVEEDDSSLYEEYLDHLQLKQNEYTEQVLLYIAGFIAKKLTKSLKCAECVALLHGSNDAYKNSIIEKKSKGGLTYPSATLFKIIKISETILKQNLDHKSQPEKYYLYIYKFLMEHFENGNIFSNENREHVSSHKLLLIRPLYLLT